ncbi:hypothetical protein QBC41DRAFT_386150 [Cercophora samala]|uniref:Uncharacterized protein n=1 Tax=Cercophora samala TaxID=330535 RepID=A0AA39ZI63_9PEZI|nr:hypothetical protein QBC41DRAFT_386150 [Cercophora samala]
MSSSESDQSPYHFYDDPWSPPMPTSSSWESRPTDLSSSADREAYFFGSYVNTEEYNRASSTLEYALPDPRITFDDEHPARFDHPAKDEDLIHERRSSHDVGYALGDDIPSLNDLGSSSAFLSPPAFYNSSKLGSRGLEEEPQHDSYGDLLDLEFSRLKLAELDHDCGYQQEGCFGVGTWAKEEQDVPGVRTPRNEAIPNMYDMYQYKGDNYVLSQFDEPHHNIPGRSKRRHFPPQTSKPPKKSSSRTSKTTKPSTSHSAKIARSSAQHDQGAPHSSSSEFPRDKYDAWIYLTPPAQMSSSTSTIPARARYDTANFLGPIIKTELAYELGFDKNLPLEDRKRTSFMPSGLAQSYQTMGTITLFVQTNPHESFAPEGIDFHMFDAVLQGYPYDVLLPFSMMPGNQGASHHSDSVPGVAATQGEKYKMTDETEEERRERLRIQQEEAERLERERQERREAARQARKQRK